MGLPEIRKDPKGWFVWFPAGPRFLAVETWMDAIEAVCRHYKTQGEFPGENRWV